jgi:hypothetical protein
MNTRAVCDNHSKLSVKLPEFARHEKLAFIDLSSDRSGLFVETSQTETAKAPLGAA